jgi:hypothetical protein
VDQEEVDQGIAPLNIMGRLEMQVATLQLKDMLAVTVM